MAVQLKGMQELEQALSQLAPKIQANVIRGAMRTGAKVMQQAAKENVPVKSGALKDTIRVGSSLRGGIAIGRVMMGSRVKGGSRKGAAGADRGAFYANMIEFGVKPHEIRPKGGKSFFFAGFNHTLIHHPGFAGKHILQNAMDSNVPNVMKAVGEYMNKRMGTTHGMDSPDPEVLQDGNDES